MDGLKQLEGMTGSSFVKHAPKMTLQLSWEGISEEDLRDNRFSLAPKKFRSVLRSSLLSGVGGQLTFDGLHESTGSFGWGANAKLEGPSIVIGESAWDNVPVNMSANFTVCLPSLFPLPSLPSLLRPKLTSDSALARVDHQIERPAPWYSFLLLWQ